MNKPYKQVEHPSDIGLEVWGSSVYALFAHAAEGMFAVMTDLETVSPKKKILLKVKEDAACGYEEALVAWLEELIFQFETEKNMLCRFHMTKVNIKDGLDIQAEGWGERFVSSRHEIKLGIKAVTYQGLEVRKNKKWKAKVIFDV